MLHLRGPPEHSSSIPVLSLSSSHPCHQLKKLVGVGEGVRKVDVSDSTHPSFVTWQRVVLLSEPLFADL